MAQVLRDLKDLAVLLGGVDLAPDAPDPHPTDGPAEEPDLAALLSQLEAARVDLADAARRDEEVRAAALRDLAAHDALVAAQREAEAALAGARDLRRRAEALAATAFDDAARGAADRIAGQAARAEETAGRLAGARRGEAEAFAAAHDLAPALAERARAHEAEKARAAAAERAGRLSGLLAQARAALEARRLEEATKLLGTAVNEFPGEPGVASLQQMLHQREVIVKTKTAEEALAFARRELRRDPEAAVERLSALDVDGLSEELARQLFGAWLRACARLCRERGLAEPLRYAPRLGRGVLLVRDGDGYVVRSALGAGAAWPVGAPVGEAVLRRARPLAGRPPGPGSRRAVLDLSRLTAEQRRVVLAPDGPMLVLAGPGSGKTTVLAARVAYLVAARGVGPRGVLALVFTTSAARELRARLVQWLGEPGRLVEVSTIHAFGFRVLRHWCAELGFAHPRLTVCQPDEARALLRQAAEEFGLRPQPGALAELAARVERHRLGHPATAPAEPMAALAGAYEALLRRRGAVDFPAMLALPLRLLEARPAARRVLEEAYRHIMADEAQDVAASQYRLLCRLAARHRNLVLVADTRQAIFGWRGADAGYLRAFREDFPDARTFGLNENFRSTARIVALANALGAPLGGQPLWTRNPAGEPPWLHVAPDEPGEAAMVVERIRRLRDDGAVGRLDDVAVLYRTNRQAEALALALRRAELPCRVRPHGDPFGRREVRDALAYLRLAHDPDDASALVHVVDAPPRGLARLAAVLRRRPIPARDLPALAGAFGPAATASAEALLTLVRELHARAAEGPADLLDLALERSGYRAWLADRPDGAARLGSLAALRALATDARGDLTAWLAELAVGGAEPTGPNRERVLLTTVHASKGGEWGTVFVVGADDGLLPLLRTGRETASDLNAERRVAFVAVTRPRSRLYLSYSRRRSRDGRPEPRRLSRFLRELPPGLLASAV